MKQARIYVAGGSTMIGSAIVRRLLASGCSGVIADREPDFGDRAAVDAFFARTAPEYVFVAAGMTAGIGGNERFPADLMLDNLLVASHVVPAAWRSGAKKLLYLSSSCTYPRQAPQPMKVGSLWTGELEATSAPYGTAKLSGMMLCQAFRRQHNAPFVTAIAADAYGPGDDFGEDSSHVVAALLRRIHEAKVEGKPAVTVWGSGAPRREFIFVDDVADASIFAMERYDGAEPINLGTGMTTSIADLASLVGGIIGYQGTLAFDRSRPDGMPFKGLDASLLAAMGWRPRWTLEEGLAETYRWAVSARRL